MLNLLKLTTLAQVREFLQGTQTLELVSLEDPQTRYAHVAPPQARSYVESAQGQGFTQTWLETLSAPIQLEQRWDPPPPTLHLKAHDSRTSTPGNTLCIP